MKKYAAILLAVILGLAAAVGVFVYTAGAEQRALQADEPSPVVVSVDTVPAGLSLGAALEQGIVEETVVPAASRPEGAISGITSENEALMAISALSPGQILLESAFSSTPPSVGPLSVPEGMVAISLALQDPEQVAGFLRPGSQIAVLLTEGGPTTSGDKPARTTVLEPRLTVLAVGASVDGEETPLPAGSGETTLITVAADQEQALRLVQGVRTGLLYLALLGPDSELASSASASGATSSGGSGT